MEFLKHVSAEKSYLTRSFWYGKFLQCLSPRALQGPDDGGGCSASGRGDGERLGAAGGVGERGERGGGVGGGSEGCGNGGEGGVKIDTDSSDRNVIPNEFGWKPLSYYVSIAQQCLKQYETSLSPNVFKLLTNAIPADYVIEDDGTALPDFLQQDYTLSWSSIEGYLGQGGYHLHVVAL